MSDDAQKQGNPPLKRFANLALDGETVANPTRPIPQQAPPLPRRSPYAPFDAQARADFCDRIRNGVRSRSGAMRILRLCPTTVNAWIARGKVEDWPDEDYEYRAFYLDLKAAEAAREALVDLTLGRAAQGFQATVDGEGETIVRVVPDWRAADALGKRQERGRVLEHEVNAARAKADASAAEARIAKAKADVAERAAQKFAGVVLFPADFLERCSPETRANIEAEMIRNRLLKAPAEMVEEAIAEQDTSDLDEIEAALERHPRRLPAPKRDTP